MILTAGPGPAARRDELGPIPSRVNELTLPVQTGVGVGDDGRQRLVDLMGDRGRELAHRRHAGDVRELRLRLLQRFLGPLRSVMSLLVSSVAAGRPWPSLCKDQRLAETTLVPSRRV